MSTSSALGLEYEYVRSLSVQHNPALAPFTQSITPGDNITFVVRSWASARLTSSGTVGLHVFVVDPEGLVNAVYPAGDTLESISSNNVPLFSGAGTISQYNNPLAQSGIQFTTRVPNDNLSIGVWRVYVFITDLEYTGSQPTTYYGASTAGFAVSPAVQPNIVFDGFGILGAALTVYGIETITLTSAIRVGKAHRQWFAENLLLLAGLLLLAAYLYLVYFRA